MSAKLVLMIIGDFVEDYETMVPYQILTMFGHAVSVVSPGKKAGESVKTAIHDFEGDQTYSEKLGHNFTLNATFSDINPEEYDALVIPGGRAPEFLRLNEKVIKMVKHFAKAKKPIAAICHGPQILATADILQHKKCTAYPTLRPDIELAGGHWVKENSDYSNAVTCENVVTAPAWTAHPEWMKHFLKLLGSKFEA